jgi:hypothetical protein
MAFRAGVSHSVERLMTLPGGSLYIGIRLWSVSHSRSNSGVLGAPGVEAGMGDGGAPAAAVGSGAGGGAAGGAPDGGGPAISGAVGMAPEEGEPTALAATSACSVSGPITPSSGSPLCRWKLRIALRVVASAMPLVGSCNPRTSFSAACAQRTYSVGPAPAPNEDGSGGAISDPLGPPYGTADAPPYGSWGTAEGHQRLPLGWCGQ